MFKNSLIILIILFGFQLHAQTEEEQAPNSYSLQISVMAALTSFDYGQLNTVLQSKGLPETQDGFILMPFFTIKSSLDRMDFVESTIGRYDNEKTHNNHTLEQQIFYGEMGYGRYIFERNRHSAYLGAGLGNVWYNVDIHDNADAGSFSDALDDYSGFVKINSRNNYFISINSGYDWVIDRNNDILLGLRAAYRIGLGKETWLIKDRAFDDSPQSAASGFLIGLTLSIR